MSRGESIAALASALSVSILAGYGAFHLILPHTFTANAAIYSSGIAGLTGILLGKWTHILFSSRKFKVLER